MRDIVSKSKTLRSYNHIVATSLFHTKSKATKLDFLALHVKEVDNVGNNFLKTL